MGGLTYTGPLIGPKITVPFQKQLNELRMKAKTYKGEFFAGITSKNFSAYYGDEVIDEKGEWCFEAKFGTTVIKIPFSKLGCSDRFNCMECLMKGVAWIFEKYNIS